MRKVRLGTILLTVWGILLSAFVFTYLTWLQPSRLGTTVSSVLESTLGVHCDIGRVSLSFSPLPEVTISDLSIHRGSVEHVEFTARRATVQVSWFSLLRLKPIVRSITLDSPTLDISGSILKKDDSSSAGKEAEEVFTLPDIPRYITGLHLTLRNGTCRLASADGKDSLSLSGLNVKALIPSLVPGSLDVSVSSIRWLLASGIDLSAKDSRLSVSSLFKGLDDEWEGKAAVSTAIQLGSLDTAMGRRISDPYRYFPMPEPIRFSFESTFSADVEEALYYAAGRTALSALLPMNGHNVPISLDVPFTMTDLENGIAVSKADVRMGDDRLVIDGIISGLPQGQPLLKGRADVHHFSLTRWFGFGRLMDPGLQHALDNIRAVFHDFELTLKGVVVPRLTAWVEGIELHGSGSCTAFLKPVVRIDAHARKADLNRVFTELHGEFPDLSHLPPPVLPLTPTDRHTPPAPGSVTVGYDIHISADDAKIMNFNVGGADVHVIPAPQYGTMLTIDVGDVYGGKADSKVYIQDKIRVVADLNSVALAGPSAALAGHPVLTGSLKDGKVDISFEPGNGIQMLTSLGGSIKATMENGAICVKDRAPVPYERFLVDAEAKAVSGRNAKTMPPFVNFVGRWSARYDSKDWAVQTDNAKATLAFSTKYGLPWIIKEQNIPLSLTLKKSLCPAFTQDIKLAVSGKASLDLDKGTMSLKKGTAEHSLFGASGNADFTSIFHKPSVSGQARLHSPALKDTAALFGIALPAEPGTDAFTTADMQSRFAVSAERLALSELRGTLDGSSISGSIACDWKDRTHIEGRLSTAFLDLDRYLPQKTEEQKESAARTRLPLDFLKNTDVRLKLSADRFRVFSVQLSKVSASVTQEGGILSTPLDLTFPGGGRASGLFKAELSADGKQADIALQARAPQINMLELCLQRGQKTLISGTGSAELSLQSTQKYWDDWKRTLGGFFTFLVTNGAILTPPAPGSERAQTPSRTSFSIMSMSGTVHDGIVSCKDFRIQDSMLDVHGEGTVDLDRESIDAHATITLAGIPEMPVELKGNMFSPQVNYKLLGAVTGTVGNIGSSIFDLMGTIITAPFKLFTGKSIF